MEKIRYARFIQALILQGLYDNQSNHQPDLLVLRHVLEHQSNVKEFISNISHENPEYIFIEIPCYEFVSRKNYHFFSYEHCSYFSKHSLKLLMSKFGYENIFLNMFLTMKILYQFLEKIKNLLMNKKKIQYMKCKHLIRIHLKHFIKI